MFSGGSAPEKAVANLREERMETQYGRVVLVAVLRISNALVLVTGVHGAWSHKLCVPKYPRYELNELQHTPLRFRPV